MTVFEALFVKILNHHDQPLGGHGAQRLPAADWFSQLLPLMGDLERVGEKGIEKGEYE